MTAQPKPLTMSAEQWDQLVFETRVAFTGCTNIWDNDRVAELLNEAEAMRTLLAERDERIKELDTLLKDMGTIHSQFEREIAARDAQWAAALAGANSMIGIRESELELAQGRAAAAESRIADLKHQLGEYADKLDCMVDPEEHRQKLAELERERDEARREGGRTGDERVQADVRME